MCSPVSCYSHMILPNVQRPTVGHRSLAQIRAVGILIIKVTLQVTLFVIK